MELDREAEVGLADLGLFWRKAKRGGEREKRGVEVEVERVSDDLREKQSFVSKLSTGILSPFLD